jgi:superfamily I DNA/RNA helicase
MREPSEPDSSYTTSWDSTAIEFCHLDRLAYRICVEAGDRPTIDPRKVEATFAAALRRSGTPLTLSREYLREEITYVIKGRGITTLDAYLAVERTGRRTPLNPAAREQVWALKMAWDEALAEVGAMDFPDIVTRARDHARSRDEPTYRAAIIDEAQDLTLVGLQLVRALVNGRAGVDRPDGLLVVGDGAQRVYPGGFTLRQAGVEVRGRTTVLRTNYRNSAEIIAAAMAVAGSEAVDDLGDTYARADASASASRAGQRPVLTLCGGHTDEIRVIVEHIDRLTGSGGVSRGDLAVSASTNAQVEEIAKQLALAEVPTIKLADYDGTPVDKVKVGTHFRIKGLEFKVVFLPRLGAADFPRRLAPGQTPEENADQRALSISQLFVAMTRARDELWLLASGEPSEVLVGALDAFDVVNS